MDGAEKETADRKVNAQLEIVRVAIIEKGRERTGKGNKGESLMPREPHNTWWLYLGKADGSPSGSGASMVLGGRRHFSRPYCRLHAAGASQ